ncbi:MAG: TlpA family protein disulfide reductase [Bacteroidales bacterium]|jgi:thiol-disulfide isomerase/thioredoxin|nr:TlpA family protein disulfide reductase [Bacteroidales bacterium]
MKKNNLYLGLALIAAICCTSCGRQSDVTLSGTIEGWNNERIFIAHSPLHNPDSVGYDTIQATDGKFTYDRIFSVPTIVKLNAENVEQANIATQLELLLQPNEKVSVAGKYEDEFLSYKAKGVVSDVVSTVEEQSKLRESSKTLYVTVSSLYKRLKEMTSQEDIDEKVADSLYDLYVKQMEAIAQKKLEYVKAHLDHDLAVLYLFAEPRKDTLLKYYNQLSDKIKQSRLSERLRKSVEAARVDVIKRNNEEAVKAGSQAPSFALYDLKGKERKLEEFKGKYVVLDFWGTWCIWCVRGMPQMKTYYEKYKGKVEFIGIACRDTKERVSDFATKENIPWVMLINGEKQVNGSTITFDKEVSLLYGVAGYPTKFILDKDLKIVGRFLGEGEDFYEKLDELLK